MQSIDIESMIRANKMKDSKKLLDDIISSIDLRKEDYPLVEEDLQKWLDDESYFSRYDMWELTKPATLIVRLYRFEKEGKLLGAPQYKILPIVKVIKAHPLGFGGNPAKYKAGDVLSAPDSVAVIKVNDEWLMWKNAMEKERPAPIQPAPNKFGGTLMEWSKNKFIADKLYPVEDDNWTFLATEDTFGIRLDKTLFKFTRTDQETDSSIAKEADEYLKNQIRENGSKIHISDKPFNIIS